MKILHVITRSEIGGAQVVVLNLVKHMPPGYSLVVAAGEDGFLKDECERIGVPFRKVPRLIRSINPMGDLLALAQLVRLIRREQVDIVHAHTSKAGALARMAAWLTGTPSVFTAHTWSFDAGMSSLQRTVAASVEKLAAMAGGPIIAVSDANRSKALSSHIAGAQKIKRIWLGLPESAPLAHPGKEGTATLIMTARFAKQKDHATLLRALAGATGQWKLRLVGEGPLWQSAKDLAAKLGVADRVDFMGNRQDVADLMAQSDVFVLATNWEGLPVSILEAMRAGLPVVATNVGGISEMVEDNVSGYLTRPGDVEQLRSRLQRLIDCADLRKRMGAMAHRRFVQDFRMEACIREHVKIYQSVLAVGAEASGLQAPAA